VGGGQFAGRKLGEKKKGGRLNFQLLGNEIAGLKSLLLGAGGSPPRPKKSKETYVIQRKMECVTKTRGGKVKKFGEGDVKSSLEWADTDN